MFEIFRAGGPLMWIILVCSLVALTIIFERALTLRKNRVAPHNLREQILELVEQRAVTDDKIEVISRHSPLGEVYAAGLSHIPYGTEAMKEAFDDAGKQVVHRLGRYLNTLGTIASITPLIGLLGTVIGMIKVFTAITVSGVGDPTVLSGGISEALITTAAGLSVGIPCLACYRHFRSRINELTMILEDHALWLIDAVRMLPAKTTHKVATQNTATKKKGTR